MRISTLDASMFQRGCHRSIEPPSLSSIELCSTESGVIKMQRERRDANRWRVITPRRTTQNSSISVRNFIGGRGRGFGSTTKPFLFIVAVKSFGVEGTINYHYFSIPSGLRCRRRFTLRPPHFASFSSFPLHFNRWFILLEARFNRFSCSNPTT